MANDRDKDLADRLFEEKFGSEEEMLAIREKLVKSHREEAAKAAKKTKSDDGSDDDGRTPAPRRRKVIF